MAKFIGATLMVTVDDRFGREPVPASLRGTIFKHFIVNSDIGENDVIRTGKIKKQLSAFIKAAGLKAAIKAFPLGAAKTEL